MMSPRMSLFTCVSRSIHQKQRVQSMMRPQIHTHGIISSQQPQQSQQQEGHTHAAAAPKSKRKIYRKLHSHMVSHQRDG